MYFMQRYPDMIIGGKSLLGLLLAYCNLVQASLQRAIAIYKAMCLTHSGHCVKIWTRSCYP